MKEESPLPWAMAVLRGNQEINLEKEAAANFQSKQFYDITNRF